MAKPAPVSKKQKQLLYKKLITILLLITSLGGAVMVCVGLLYYYNDKSIEKNPGIVTGVITDKYDSGGDGGTYYYLKYTFKVPDSSSTYSNTASGLSLDYWDTTQIGQSVAVLYDTSKPENSYIKGHQSTSLLDRNVVILGLLLTPMAVIALWVMWLKR